MLSKNTFFLIRKNLFISKMRSLMYLNKYLLKYKSKLCLGILFVILSNIFSLLPAKFIGDAFRVIEIYY